MTPEKKQQFRRLAFYLHEQRKWGRHSVLWGLLTLGSLTTTGCGVYQKNPILTVAGAETSVVLGVCTQKTFKKRANAAYRVRQEKRMLGN